MAWLDDSSMFKEEKNKTRIFKDVGDENKNVLWKLRFLNQLPFINMVINYLKLAILNKKLSKIEKKIHYNNLDNTSLVLALLREILHLKRQYKFISSKIKTDERIQKIKKFLIEKSHQVTLVENEESILKRKTLTSSHQTILALINDVPIQKTHFIQDMPGKVYWRYEQTKFIEDGHSLCKSTIKPRDIVYLHTSVSKLIEILKNPINGNLSLSGNDFKITNNELLSNDCKDLHLVCGLSLKLSNTLNLQSSKRQQISFWEDKLAKHKLTENNLNIICSKQIFEIFFNSIQYYDQFKGCLHKNREAKILELIYCLEGENKIRIHQSITRDELTP